VVIRGDTLFEDRAVTLLSVVERLPALEDFGISFQGSAERLRDPISDSNGLPRCGELAEMHSRSLIRLGMSMLGGPAQGNTLRLVGLPELRSCLLTNEPKVPMNLRIDAESFAEVPKLQKLQMCFDDALHLQPGSLHQLTALTSLTLAGCGLLSVPPDVARLSATLRVLDINRNDQLHLDASDAAIILSCGRLRVLGLYKPDMLDWKSRVDEEAWEALEVHMEGEGYTPAQFSIQSLVQLLPISNAFWAQHGHALPVVLTEDEYMKYLHRA